MSLHTRYLYWKEPTTYRRPMTTILLVQPSEKSEMPPLPWIPKSPISMIWYTVCLRFTKSSRIAETSCIHSARNTDDLMRWAPLSVRAYSPLGNIHRPPGLTFARQSGQKKASQIVGTFHWRQFESFLGSVVAYRHLPKLARSGNCYPVTFGVYLSSSSRKQTAILQRISLTFR